MVTTAPRLVIWDWNGTLLDDTEFCYEIANTMRKERGMPTMASVEEYRSLFCFPVIEYYRRMGYTFETESYEAISVEFVARYAAGVAACPLQPGTVETLKEIKRRGLRQVLLSATGSKKLAEQVDMFGLRPYFDEIIGCENDLAHGKVDNARALIRRAGLARDEALFVGDTDHDYEVSKAAGCRCLLLTAGHQTKAHLSALGVPLLANVSDVLTVL